MQKTYDQNQRDILLRIYCVHGIRRVMNPLILASITLSVSLVGMAFMVSLKNIISNLSQIDHFYNAHSFFYGAFTHTTFVVQISTLMFLFGLSLLFYKIARISARFFVSLAVQIKNPLLYFRLSK